MRQRGRVLLTVVVVALLTALPAALAQPAVAQAQAGGDGLLSESAYESPQFGYGVAWEAPWTADPSLTVSTFGSFDTLWLDGEASSVRFFGTAADVTSVEFLQVAIEIQIEDDPATEVIGEDIVSDIPSATLEYVAPHPDGSGNVPTREYMEVLTLEPGQIRVLVALQAPIDAWETELTAATEAITLNGDPILTGATDDIDAPPPAPPDPETLTTPAVDVETPEPEPTPTEPAQIAVTPEPDLTPEPTPTDPEIATDVETPEVVGEGVVGNMYSSPNFGFSLGWDETIWTVGEELTEPGYDLLLLRTDASSVYIEGFMDNQGDPVACLETGLAQLEAEEGVSDFTLASDQAGNPLTGSDDISAYAVYTLTFTADTGDSIELAQYVECFVLIPDAAVLQVTQISALADYNDEVDTVQALVASILLPPDVTFEPDDPTDPDEPISHEAHEVHEGHETGATITDQTFTSPTYGYALTWDDTWTVERGEASNGDELLELTNGISTVILEARTDVPTDPTGCVQAVVAELSREVGALTLATDNQGAPLRGSDDASAFATYTYVGEAADGTAGELARFVRCQSLPTGEAMLLFSQIVPLADYDAQLPARRALLDGLQVPEA